MVEHAMHQVKKELERAVGVAFNEAYDAFCASLRGSQIDPRLATVIIDDVKSVLLMAHEAALEAIHLGFEEPSGEFGKN